MKKAELKSYCKENGIKNYSTLNKQELIKYILQYQKGGLVYTIIDKIELCAEKINLLFYIYEKLSTILILYKPKRKPIIYLKTQLIAYCTKLYIFIHSNRISNSKIDSIKGMLYSVACYLDDNPLKNMLEKEYHCFLSVFTKHVGKDPHKIPCYCDSITPKKEQFLAYERDKILNAISILLPTQNARRLITNFDASLRGSIEDTGMFYLTIRVINGLKFLKSPFLSDTKLDSYKIYEP